MRTFNFEFLRVITSEGMIGYLCLGTNCGVPVSFPGWVAICSFSKLKTQEVLNFLKLHSVEKSYWCSGCFKFQVLL